MAFWEQATDQAGREFGARYWRWFAAARAVRRFAPMVSVVVILGALVVVYRLVSPDWGAIGSSMSGWLPSADTALVWALMILAGVAVTTALAGVGVWVGRNWWRWSLSRPMWMRRY